MAKFTVKSNILQGGKMFRPGDSIELTAEQAAQMPWAVSSEAPADLKSRPRTAAEKAEDAEREKLSKIEREAAEKFKAESEPKKEEPPKN